MSLFGESFFRNHITFTSVSDLQQLIKPFQAQGLINFSYRSYFQDGSGTIKLDTNPEYLELYYRKKLFQKSFYLTQNIQNGIFVSEWVQSNAIHSALNRFGLSPTQVLSIIKTEGQLSRHFHFFINENLSESNYLQWYSTMCSQFIDYFKQKGADLIQRAEKNLLILPIPRQPDCFPLYDVLPPNLTVDELKHIYLTGRELDIISLLMRGKTIVDISKQLGVSRKTMDVHVSHIKHKLHCKTLLEVGIKLGYLFSKKVS